MRERGSGCSGSGERRCSVKKTAQAEKVWAVFLLVMIFSSCGSIIDLFNHQSRRQQGERI